MAIQNFNTKSFGVNKMKVINNTTKFLLVALIICLIVVAISLTGCNEEEKIIRYSDINLYINNNYDKLIDHYGFDFFCNRAKQYLPEHDEFEYKQFIKGFYLFDGAYTFGHTQISVVLELQFNNSQEYEKFIAYEHDRCEYTNKFNISRNDYICYIAVDEDYTKYRYQAERPYMLGMLCENKNNLTVRYVYFEERELDVDEQFNRVFTGTNCEW